MTHLFPEISPICVLFHRQKRLSTCMTFQSAWLNKLACGAPLHVHGYQKNKRPPEVASMLAYVRWLDSNNRASRGAWPLVRTAWTRVHALAIVVLYFHACWCHSGVASHVSRYPNEFKTSANLAPPQKAFPIAETIQPTPFTFMVLASVASHKLQLCQHWHEQL